MRLFLIALTPIFTAGSLCFGFMPGIQHVALIVYALRARGLNARFHSRGVLLSALSHFVWLPLFAAASAGLPHDTMGYIAAAAAASVVHAAIFAPYALFVPAHLTVPPPDRGVITIYAMPNLDRALAQWDRLSWKHRFGLLALRVVPVVASVALFFVFREWLSWRVSFLLASYVYGLGTFAYAEAAASAHVLTWKADEVPVASARYLTLPALACTLLGAVFLAYGLAAATEPAPMAAYEGPMDVGLPTLVVPFDPVLHANARPLTEDALLPGTDIRLRPFPGGVSVETADGGGAGPAEFLSPYEDQPETVTSDTWVAVTSEGFEVYQEGSEWRYFTIDATGVRTDDGLARRLRHGLGSNALLFFAGGLLLIALCVWLIASATRVRRRLIAIRSVEELDTPQCTGAIEGTFHGKAYNVSGFEGRKIIQVKGEGEVRAHLGGSLLRFRIPESGTSGIGTPADGQPVTLTGVFSKLQGRLREASAEWPEDALLLAGDKDEVGLSLVRRSLRPALIVLVFAAAAWVSALLCVTLHRLPY
ncbi:MAG: hypothetical protein AB8H86_23225 [Polyangiales bacterium]